MVGVRLLESRNVPGSDVRSQSGVEPPAFGRTHIPSTPRASWSGANPGSSFPVHVSPDSSAPERVTLVDDSGKDAGTTGGATVDHARPRPAVSKRKLTSKLASRASTNLAAGPSCRCTRRGRQARGVAPSSRRSDASAARNDARMPKPLVSGLGSRRHGRARGNNKLAISTVQGSRRSRVHSCVRWLRGVRIGLDGRTRLHIQVDLGGKGHRHRTA